VTWADPSQFKWIWMALGLLFFFALSELWKAFRLRRYAGSSAALQLVSSLSRPLRVLKTLLFLAALALVVVGLARPQSQGKTVMAKATGVDIVIAVDVSDSMLAQDIPPSRIEKAKLELQDLVETTRGDRIGVVAFAGEAYGQVPLTLDRSSVKLFLRSLSPGMVPEPGTGISKAIRASLSLFDFDNSSGRVVILLTDGEDHEEDPAEIARQAAEAGVRIFTIGIGTAKGEMIPIRGEKGGVQFKKDARGQIVVSKLGEDKLKEIAQITGGQYYPSQRGSLEVEKIYRSIRSLEQKETGSGWIVETDPRYQPYVLLAVLLLLLESLLSERKWERS
jgi:Ca-activated chloride channel family protein